MPVDIEEDIDAGRQHLLNRFTRRAVIVAKDLCMFQKRVFANHRAEFVVIHEEIVFAVHFTRTRRPRGMGDRYLGVIQRLGF